MITRNDDHFANAQEAARTAVANKNESYWQYAMICLAVHYGLENHDNFKEFLLS